MKAEIIMSFDMNERRAFKVLVEFAKLGMEQVYKDMDDAPENECMCFYGNAPDESLAAYQLACKLYELL
jgi:hypothetical protein